MADGSGGSEEPEGGAQEDGWGVLLCLPRVHRLLQPPGLGEGPEAQDAGGGEDQVVADPKGHPNKPKIISSDNGQEFQGLVPAFLDEKGIAQRYKSIGDVNALGLVDRAIQQLKLKISEILSTRAAKTWVDVLPDAVAALNSYPKDVLHGAAPKDVRTDKQVNFMLLEDQAKNAETNMQLTRRRATKLTEAGGFRAPLPESTLKFKRGAQATYGEVKAVANIKGSTVTDAEGKQMDIKRVKAVPLASTAAQGRFGAVNNRLQAQKREKAGRIIVELCKLLEDRDQISLASAAVQMRNEMDDYDALLTATSSTACSRSGTRRR